MAGVITASEPSWIAPFTGLSPCSFGKLLTSLRREGADATRPGRPWPLPLEDRVLLVAAYWRTNLTLRQLAPLFGVSKSAADRIIDQLGPQLALKQRQRFRHGGRGWGHHSERARRSGPLPVTPPYFSILEPGNASVRSEVAEHYVRTIAVNIRHVFLPRGRRMPRKCEGAAVRIVVVLRRKRA